MSGVKKKSHDMHAVSNRIDALEQTDFRVHVACSPRHRHSLCLPSLHQSRVSCRCCLASFLVAWVRKMGANHCLGLVMVSPPANSCRMLACSLLQSLIRDFQFDRCSLLLDLAL